LGTRLGADRLLAHHEKGIVVKAGVVLVTAAVLAIGGTVGCSSSPAPAKAPPGVLPAGTAQFTVNGRDVGTTGAVSCQPINWVTTIKTGDEASGATVMVSTAKGLTVEYVRIRDLNGFTGSFNRGLEGAVKVAMSGPTYDISGSALGYGPKSLDPMTEPFAMKVTC
jgi:ipoprotein LpqH